MDLPLGARRTQTKQPGTGGQMSLIHLSGLAFFWVGMWASALGWKIVTRANGTRANWYPGICTWAQVRASNDHDNDIETPIVTIEIQLKARNSEHQIVPMTPNSTALFVCQF